MLASIVAISQNNCIGKDGDLPWHIPEDLKHFKDITNGHTVIMGRKTWESIPEKFRPLKNRENIIITRNEDYDVPDGVKIFTSFERAVEHCRNKYAFVIGGASLYNLAMDFVDTLYITHVDREVDGDTFFPEIDLDVWKETERDDREGFSFVTYLKK